MVTRKPTNPGVAPGLRRELAEAGFSVARWGHAGEGWEAVSHSLTLDDGRELVLKVAREGVPDVAVPIEAEAEALQAFAAALDPAGTVHAPRVLHISREHHAYLMEQAPGATLFRYVLKPWLPRGWETTLARRLVDGLAIYHGSFREPFGDFHPGNVVVGGSVEPWFLDPVARHQATLMRDQAGAFAPGAADVGLFVFKVVSRVPRPAAVTPWAVWRLVWLSRSLVREAGARFAPGNEAAFEAAVRDVALAHLAVLDAQRWPRDRASAFAGRKLLRVVLRRA
ncbi:MAG: hypothetical protein HY875_15900 [Chloroflexi bacterium]|nr:hypothetical protein [Chloroflexota bacterium]